ncbi:MAG: DUF2341 domain-containing protein, partial [Methanobacteriota archaeon]
MNTKKNIIKIFKAGLVLVMLCSATIAVSISTTNTDDDKGRGGSPPLLANQHTVLTEEGTATTCGYCPQVMVIMHDLFESGLYDFYNVALVINQNTYASSRASELGITGTPTVVFDGGYSRIVGAGPPPSSYINNINSCHGRTVADIDLHLDVLWLGNAQIQVALNVTNNEVTAYSGHIHAYVTEINSRWWNSGNQYHHAMIGALALNQNVNVPAVSTSTYTSVWNGNLYGMGDIVAENIMVIAAVFRTGTNYVDETTASLVRDIAPPTWQNQGQNRTTIQRGEPITLYAQGKDNRALNYAKLATNETGTWQNYTGVYGSPIYLGGIGDQWIWSNFSWQNWAVPQGRRVGWRIYYNDTTGNWNKTNIMSFTVLRNPIIHDYSSTLASTGESFMFNASAYDDDGIANVYVDYWYDGGHTNLSMNPVGGYYQRTITVATDKTVLHYLISAKDTTGLWSHTSERIVNIADTIPPEWRNQGQSVSVIPPGGTVILSAQGSDNIGLDYAYLSTNETGVWLDYASLDYWDLNWGFSKQIVIDHTKVPGDLTNFPVLITCTSPDFVAHAQTDGDDFAFINPDNETKYAHEIESYTSVSGELVAWVNVPFISSTTDTIFYMYYGNLGCANQEDVEGTWSNGYVMVHHLDGAVYTEFKDSTSNHWDITSMGGNPVFDQPGKIGTCVDFDGNGDYLKADAFQMLLDGSHTAGAWVRVDGNAGSRKYLFESHSDAAVSLLIWTNETFKSRTHTSDVFPVCYAHTQVNPSNPQWYYVCTRVDAANDRLDILVNGVYEAGTLFTGTVNPATGFDIGMSNLNSYWMNGKIDEIHVSDVARSNEWITTEYNMMNDPTTFTSVGEEIMGISAYGSPVDLNTGSGEWIWTDFTWENPAIPEGTVVGWKVTYADYTRNHVVTNIMSFMISSATLFQITGDCYYQGMIPANTVSVEILNLDTG